MGFWRGIGLATGELGEGAALAACKQVVRRFVGGQEEGGDFAVAAGPVKEDFLVFWVKVVWCVGAAYVAGDAAWGIAEEEALEELCLGGFIDGFSVESFFVEVEIGGGGGEYSFLDLFSCFDGSGDLSGEQSEVAEQLNGLVGQWLFPSAEGLNSFGGEGGEICQLEIDCLEVF